MILNELARRMLDGTFQEGDTVEVDLSGEKIIFSKVVPVETVG
jgi:ATP-dependent Clp protease ATP-binding subunit ClpA